MFGLGLALGALSSALGGSDEPERPERMPYSEAMKQAESVLQPQYGKNREQVLSDIDNNLVNRGFYGQAPGDAMKSETMGDMASNYQSQKNRYAQNLRNNQYNQDFQIYQSELQQSNQPDPFWQTVGSVAGSFMGGQGGSAAFNWLTDL